MPANPAMPTTIPMCGDALDTRFASSHVSQMLPSGKPSAAAIQMWKAAGLGQADPRLASQISPDDLPQGGAKLVTTAAISGLPGLECRALAMPTKDLTIQQIRENYRDSAHQSPPPPHDAKHNLVDVAASGPLMAMQSPTRHDDVLKEFHGGLPMGQAPLPTHIPSMAPVVSSGNSSAPIVNETELHILLENFCQSLYMGNQSGSSSFGSVVLDVGAILPGAMIEMSRQGASLQVRLYASDQQTLLVMQREREKLNASLTASTNLVVKVDAIARG